MSFILDALKKSEIERQRQTIPGLMDSRPTSPRPRFPLWAVALVVLLGINLIVLVIVLTRGGSGPSAGGGATGRATAEQAAATARAVAPEPASAPAAVPARATASTTAPGAAAAASPSTNSAPDHFSPMDSAPPLYAPEIPSALNPSASRASAASNHPASSEGGASPRRAVHMPDPVLTADEDKADNEVLPSISEISLSGQQTLPELHLDVHVFATQPSERFVYINMRKYHEGAALAEGPVLERIRRDGVVLNYQGLRFVLPRQQ